MKDEINLLKPEQAKGIGAFSFAQKSLLALYVAGFLLLVEVGLWGWFFFYSKAVSGNIETVNRAIASADLEINDQGHELEAAIGYQARLASLDKLLKDHIYWSPVFEELEKYTHKDIRYQSFVGDAANHSLMLSGSARSYTQIAKLILGLKQSKKFTEVLFRSEGASTGEATGFGFTLEIVLDPLLLKKP